MSATLKLREFYPFLFFIVRDCIVATNTFSSACASSTARFRTDHTMLKSCTILYCDYNETTINENYINSQKPITHGSLLILLRCIEVTWQKLITFQKEKKRKENRLHTIVAHNLWDGPIMQPISITSSEYLNLNMTSTMTEYFDYELLIIILVTVLQIEGQADPGMLRISKIILHLQKRYVSSDEWQATQ